jgi:phage terminase large subunit-like protein
MSGRSDPFTIGHFQRWANKLVLDSGVFVELEPFQLGFVEDVFSGRRACWLIVPEGNGKTTLLAALGLYGLRFRVEASVPIAASSKDQARIMYRQMRGFVKRSPELQKPDSDGFWFEPFDGYREIHLRTAGKTKRGEVAGRIEVHASDAGTADGVIPAPYAFLDELHRHKDELALYRTWAGKLDKRDAQLIVISTAGVPGSVFEDTRDKIRAEAPDQFVDGSFGRFRSDRIVLHEYAIGDAKLAGDMAVVKSANPLATITEERLLAKRNDPTMTDSHWLRFTCNVAAQTDSDPFIPLDAWDACGGGPPVPQGAMVCLGADGSRTWDTTVVAWASAVSDRIDVGCRVFSVREDVPHHVFHPAGKVDFGDVEEFLMGLFDRFTPIETAYDPRYLERSMEIVDMRLPSSSVVPVEPQSKNARDAYQALFTAVLEGRLRHDGDPVVAAHLANCGVDRDDRTREIRRLRKIDARKPIDAVPALALAVWRATLAEPSKYESSDLVMV